jgi:valyl-tRNA synthetase
MEIPKTYDPKSTENKWYAYWLKHNFFRSVPDSREPYTIVIPPPNVTGVLHMGHMLNNTIQDVLIRRARMQGKNACWVPGTDHASIATEAKVVAMLKDKGINKSDLSREEFLKYAWEWKEKYGGIILKQLEKLGASCDWERTKFTMDEDLSQAVIDVFVDLYNKGEIYRGVRMVNWDPEGLTAVSDEEVIYKEGNANLYFVKYPICNSKEIDAANYTPTEYITIATTRPETILGDTAVCVHPEDERYFHLKGKYAIIPMINRIVPIIFDEYIDKEFGTGALKVTPAHDINDYNLGQKHKLQTIDTLNPNGTLSKEAGFYIGEDRFVVRKKIIKDLEEKNLVVKIEQIKNKVGHSERTNAVIEPKLSMQWFLKMDRISKPALENVMNDSIKLLPEKFKNTYKHWMENVHDWCISRQLWWGQRIPAYYLPNGEIVVAKNSEEAKEIIRQKDSSINFGNDVRQDEDVLDTWFSSWLWPISVFDGFKNPENADINYYYPTNDLVTAPEILFFWVARMIIAGYEYKGQKPFTNVYLTGIVRDKQGRKMSKSLGNSPDPIDLIEKYGADGVRTGMLFCSPAGNDLPFDESLCEQGRNFSNKIWNAFRLLKGFEVDDSLAQNETNALAIRWFESKFNQELQNINTFYDKYRISDALMVTYKLIWDDFCSLFLEIIKPEFIDGKALPIDRKTYQASLEFLEKLIGILHPFMPFITEELWHLIKHRNEKECIIISNWPKLGSTDNKLIAKSEIAFELIAQIRNYRNTKQISPKIRLELFVTEKSSEFQLNEFYPVIKKIANISEISINASNDNLNAVYLTNNAEYSIKSEGFLDIAKEKETLTKDLEYNKGFLSSVMKKLENEKFVANAKPEVIAIEQRKKQDAESKIKSLEEQLFRLSSN